MYKKYFPLLLFVFSVFSSLHAQTEFQRVFGGMDSIQDGLDVKQTNDGGYIINGRITTFKANASCEDGYIIKTNSSGLVQWSDRYNTPSCWEGKSIVQTTDGGYFFAGENRSWSYNGPTDFDMYAIKINSSGALQWQRDLGDSWNDGAYAVQQTTDGGYMCFGISSNVPAGGYYKYYLVKLNNAGTLQWSNTYGGTYLDFGFDARQTQDGGYIMTGSSYSFGSGMAVFVTKADGNGNVQWGTAINGPSDDLSYGVYQTSDGGYLVTGGTDSYGVGGNDVFLVRLNSSGGVTWTKTYGAGSGECGFCVRQTPDGGFAICGGTNSIGNGGYDLFLLKTNSNGNLLWTKSYGGTGDEGPSGGMFFAFNILTDRTVKMDLTSDGGFAITSLANSFPGGNIYLVKTDSDGNSGCNETNGTFLSTTPTPTVTSSAMAFATTTQSSNPAPTVTVPSTVDSNACQCTLPIALASSAVTICQNQNTTLTASGGTTYSWSNGVTTSAISVSPTISTTYTVTVSNSCGSSNDSVKVTVNPLPTASAASNSTICPGATLTLTGIGIGTYQWSPGGQTTSSVSVSPTTNTTYTFSVTNSCGTSSDSVKVTVSNSITANISGNISLCAGQSSTLSASGGTNYSWNTTATTSSIIVSPTSAATYTVIAYSGSCSDTTSVTVNVVSTPTASISGNTSICPGNSATLNASGGGNYSWNTTATTTSIIVSPTATSSYSVIVTNANGCSDTATVSVTISPTPTVSITGNTTICNGDATTLTASGGINYSWNTGATTNAITVLPSVTTDYSVTATNANGCSGSTSVQIVVNTGPNVNISGNTVLCIGDATTLSATGGTSYSWNTSATSSSITVSPTSNTTYTVISTNASGCTSATTVTVTVSPPPNANITGNDTICAGNSTILIASGGGNYLWNTNQTTSSIAVSPTANTTYSVVVSIGSCNSSANYSVTVVPNPTANAGTSVSISQGQNATLSASGGGNYVWSNGVIGAINIVNPNSSSFYCVTVTDAHGCTDSACVTVFVKPMDCSDGIYVPNAFSPNNDDANDFFQVYFVNINCVRYFKLVIYDRWGEQVFHTNDPGFLWDGAFPGEIHNTAVFVYYMYVRFDNGDEVNKKGNVSLVR